MWGIGVCVLHVQLLIVALASPALAQEGIPPASPAPAAPAPAGDTAPTPPPAAEVAPAPAAAKTTVAVFPLKAEVGVDEKLSAVLGDYLLEQLRDSGAFGRVVGSSEIETLIGFERQKQLMSCDSQSCMAELAGALGVDFILTGSLGKIGSTYLFNVKLLNARTGAAAASLGQRLNGRDDALVDSVHPVVVELLTRGGFQPQASFLKNGGATTTPAAQGGSGGSSSSNQSTSGEHGGGAGAGPKIPLLAVGIAAAVGGGVLGVLGLVAAVGALVGGLLIRFALYVPTPGMTYQNRQLALLMPGVVVGVLAGVGILLGVVALVAGVGGVAASFL